MGKKSRTLPPTPGEAAHAQQTESGDGDGGRFGDSGGRHSVYCDQVDQQVFIERAGACRQDFQIDCLREIGYHELERVILPHILHGNRSRGGGHGWAGTQTCFYNCIAPQFIVEAPPGGIRWVLGSGKSGEQDIRLMPPSLYYQQLQDRLGKAALDGLATKEQRKHLGKYLWAKEPPPERREI